MMKKNFRIEKDYTSEELKNVFVRETALKDGMHTSSEDVIKSITEGSVVCISVSSIPKKWIDICRECAKRGCRTYLLLGEEDKNTGVGPIKGACYMQFGLKQEGSVCIVRNGPDYKAWIFPDASMEGGDEVGKKESENLYKMFCKMFWDSDGRKECYSQDQPTKDAQKSTIDEIHVDDVLSLPGNYSENVQHEIDKGWNGVSAFFPLQNYDCMIGALPNGKKFSSMTIAVSNDIGTDLSQVRKHSDKVYLAECDTPCFSTVSDGSVAIFSPSAISGKTVNWTSKRSAEEYEKYVKKFPKKWSLCDSVQIGKVVSQEVRFLDQPSKVRTVGQERSEEETVYTENIDEYFEYNEEKLSRRTKFTREHLYGKVNFEFTVRPPILPEGASEDPLNSLWTHACKKWTDALDRRSALLERTKNGFNEYQQKTKDFEKARLGADQLIRGLSDEIGKLRKVKLGEMTKAARKQFEEQYVEIFKGTNDLAKRFSDARYIDGETAKRETEKQRIEKEIQETDGKISKLSEDIGAGNERKEKIRKEIEVIDKSDSKNKEKERKKSLDEEQRKIQSSLNSLVKEKDSAEKSLTSKKAELERLKKPIAVPDDELSKILGKNEKEAEKFSFPEEDLPDSTMNCTLYCCEGVRYLAFDDGIEENKIKEDGVKRTAERLKARICIRG